MHVSGALKNTVASQSEVFRLVINNTKMRKEIYFAALVKEENIDAWTSISVFRQYFNKLFGRILKSISLQ